MGWLSEHSGHFFSGIVGAAVVPKLLNFWFSWRKFFEFRERLLVWFELWLPIMSETDPKVRYLAVKNSSILLHFGKHELGPWNCSQRPRVFSSNRAEQIYTNMMSQFCVSIPSKDKLVIQSLIALCSCLIAGPDSHSIRERLNKVLNWEFNVTSKPSLVLGQVRIISLVSPSVFCRR